MAEPFALALEQSFSIPAQQQDALAQSLAMLRRSYVARGWSSSTFERAAFHRCVAYDRDASDVHVYLRAATRGG